jgi:hypothetical protein
VVTATSKTTADTLQDLLSVLTSTGQQDLNAQIFEFIAPVDRAAFTVKHSALQAALAMPSGTKVQKGAKSAAVGKAFEELVIAMLKDSKAIQYKNNIRTTVAEVDFLIAVLPSGSCVPMLRQSGTHILGEAKCYTSSPKTEWVTELVGLMALHKTTTAILFLGSKAKKLQREIKVAIAIAAAKGAMVVPFGQTQIDKVAQGGNFLMLLSEQYVSAANHAGDLWI